MYKGPDLCWSFSLASTAKRGLIKPQRMCQQKYRRGNAEVGRGTEIGTGSVCSPGLRTQLATSYASRAWAGGSWIGAVFFQMVARGVDVWTVPLGCCPRPLRDNRQWFPLANPTGRIVPLADQGDSIVGMTFAEGTGGVYDDFAWSKTSTEIVER